MAFNTSGGGLYMDPVVSFLHNDIAQDGGIDPFKMSELTNILFSGGNSFVPGVTNTDTVIGVSVSDQPVELPAGYPSYLPRPYIDKYGRLVLRAVPLLNYELTQQDVGWIMTALQPAINRYAKHPYNITYETSESSGYGWIKVICEQKILVLSNLMNKYHDFLQDPYDQSSAVAKSIVAYAGNLLFPGLGTVALTLVSPLTSQGASPQAIFPTTGNQPGIESAGTAPAGSTPVGDSGIGAKNLLILGGLALLGLILLGDGGE